MKFFAPSLIYAGICEARLRQAYSRGTEIAELIRHGPASSAQLDHTNAAVTVGMFGDSVFDNSPDDIIAFRRTISNLIALVKPTWMNAIPLGRSAVLSQLERDEYQCFKIGALTSIPPDLDCVQWWNSEGDKARAGDFKSKDSAWVRAEYRSLMIEVGRLEGTGYEPEWVSVDDNTTGYDIGSWRFPEVRQDAKRRFIEVKHSSSLPRFYISHQEWGFAERHPESWELQFWFKDDHFPSVVLDVTRLREDVAINQGSGRWETMRIEVLNL